MVKIEFIYMKNKFIIANEDINSIFQKYSSLINKDLNELLFVYKGKCLNIGNNIFKSKNIIIFVFNKNQKKINNKKLKDIKCPKCKLLNSFIINDYINEYCKNNHKYTLSLNSFINSQKIDESKINCYRCGNNKLYYNDLIYINTKEKYICPLCLNSNENDIIDYKFKFYICIDHNKKYESYCIDCKRNLCSKCEVIHKNHKIILFKKIKPSQKRIEEIKNEKLKLSKYKDELNELKNYIITMCEYIKEKINNYNKIYDYIIDSIDNLSNYESKNNILNFKMDKLMDEVDEFLNENNINKIKNIINRYEDKINELSIIYNSDENGKIKLFGYNMELLDPKMDDISRMNSKFTSLFKYLNIDNIILIFRLLLSEKKILFIHDNYTVLTNITDTFTSILYPFKWVHTYIPVMSDQMLKNLQTFLPFLNGIHESLIDAVEKIFSDGEKEDSDEVFLVYISNDLINLSSQLKKNSKNQVKTNKYIQSNVLPLPYEKELKKELLDIRSQINQLKRKPKKFFDNILLETRMREAFIDVFVKILYEYEKYIFILDDDVVFNKILFVNTISSKENKKFYEQFIDSQLFQQFIKSILKNECSYFNRKIKEKKEKVKAKNDKKSENQRASVIEKDSEYLIRPDYLGIKENDKNLKEQSIKEKFKNDDKQLKEMQKKYWIIYFL